MVLFLLVIDFLLRVFLRTSKQLGAADLTSVSFDNLDREKAYQFMVQSRNDVGYSLNSSQVFLPMSSNSKLYFEFMSWMQQTFPVRILILLLLLKSAHFTRERDADRV